MSKSKSKAKKHIKLEGLKPSQLIRLSIEDLIKCENSPKYSIDMGDWHVPGKETCQVCLAGAVMAQTCEFSFDYDSDKDESSDNPYSRRWPEFNNLDGSIFKALNHFREGDVDEAFEKLNIENDNVAEELSRGIVEYEDNPTEFKSEMLILASDLEAAGY